MRAYNKYDVAVSYASEQSAYVERVVSFLKGNDLSVFFSPDRQDEVLAENIVHELANIYKSQCKYIFAFISHEYLSKTIPKNELDIAISRYKSGDHCLIPIYMDDARYKDISADLYFFDGSTTSEFKLGEAISKKFLEIK